MKILRRELIRHIMGNFGMIPKDDFGSRGITMKEFRIDKALKIEYDDLKTREHRVFAACMKRHSDTGQEKKFRVMCCSLKEELVLVFGVEGLPLHGLRLDYFATVADNYWGKFLVKHAETWQKISMFDQLTACAGVEKLSQSVVQWEPDDDDNSDLFSALTELVEM